MKRTPADWQEALFPEVQSASGGRYRAVLVTLKQLGLRRSEEADALGYVLVRPGRPERTHALWAHLDDLPALEEAATEIARARSDRIARESADLAAREATVDELVAAYAWLSDEDRRLVLSRLEQLPTASINRDEIDRVLVPRRLARALDGIAGVRPRGAAIAVSGDVRLSAFGHEIGYEVEDLAEIKLGDELRSLLLRPDLAEFRTVVAEAAREARAAGVSEARVALYAAVGEAWKLVENTVALLDFPNPDDADRARAGLVDHAVARLGRGGVRGIEKLKRSLREMSEDMLWSRRRELLRAGRAARSGHWMIAGDRKNPTLVYALRARLDVLDDEYAASVDRKAPMPRDLRDALYTQPLDVFAGIADAFVAEIVDEEQPDLDRVFEKVASRVAKVAGVPGFEAKKFASAVRAEFTAKKFDPRAAAARLTTLVERLSKQARETEAVQTLLAEASFAQYADFFTTARALDRQLVLYVGPTNSGKTYHALNTLAEGASGVYLAPLRLLALEGQEELEKRGRPTTFLTGEERDIREGATFWSSTIEMLNFDRVVDTVVVDEVQLLADNERGWAWSAAVVGAPARQIVMTGSPDAVPLVREIASYLGEPLEIRTLERFTPLEVHEEVSDLDDIDPGTAIVCFSRRDVLGLKQHLESKHRVSVIYGNLSPQVRREEARRFRSGETKVLVATDAIALGLNLPIKTVVFYTTWKWNGREDVRLSPAEVRQIGGRAGRYGKHDAGFVGALSYTDLDHIRGAFVDPVAPLPSQAQVRPSLQHVQTMSSVLKSASLARLLDLYRRRIRFDASQLFASVPDDMLELAAMADAVGMALDDKFTFTCAPVDMRNAYMMRNYQLWMNNFSLGRPSRIDRLQTRYERSTGEADPEAFYHAEVLVKTLTVYAWLAYRYRDLFPDLGECDRQRNVLNRYIEATLRKKGRMRRCASCGNALPPLSQFSICDSCFRGRRRR